MTFDEVAVHSEMTGWTTLSTRATTVDLLDLRADSRHALLADTSLEPGEYDQLRFDVRSVYVTDASGRHEAVMPDNELVMNAQTSVNAESTSSASIDIIADNSLHTATDGRYVFAPVMQVETRSNAQVNAQNAQSVAITGGIVQTNERVGMDVAGNLVIGGSLPPYLNITSTGRIVGYQDAPIGLNVTGMLDVNT
jgi:hypothetical protein